MDELKHMFSYVLFYAEVLIFQLSLWLVSEHCCQMNYLILITEHFLAFYKGLLCLVTTILLLTKGNSFKMKLREFSGKNTD